MRKEILLILSILVIQYAGFAQSGIDGRFDKDYFVIKLKNEPFGVAQKSSSSSQLFDGFDIEWIKEIHKNKSKSRSNKSVLDGIYKIKLNNPSKDLLTQLKQLELHPNVIYAEPIYYDFPLEIIPNDPLSNPTNGNQYYLSLIKAYDAWEFSRANSSIRIAVLDTGIEPDHQDLGNLHFNVNDSIDGIDNDGNGFVDDFMGWDFADMDNDPISDQSDHGLRVTSIANAEVGNGIGLAGVGFDASYVPIKIFRSENGISNNAYDAIMFAADEGYEILNLSWGSVNSFSQFRQDIIDYAVLEKNVVIVAAAGNTPENLDFFPASYNHVLSVAATDQNDFKADFSTFSYHVDLTAPGSQISAASSGNAYDTFSGTSFAAPQVAGAAALLKHLHPDWSAIQIMEQIRVTTDNIDELTPNNEFSERLGSGRLNTLRMLTEQNTKSVRVDDFTIDNGFGEFAFFGDTITLNLNLTNYLSAVENLQITLTSENSEVIMIDEIKAIEKLDSLEEKLIEVKFLLTQDAGNDETLLFRIGFIGDNYNDRQFINFNTSSDRIDFGIAESFMTTNSLANLGYIDFSVNDGIGFQWNENRILEGMGLMIADEGRGIAENATISLISGIRSRDFEVNTPIKLYKHPAADFYASGILETTDQSALDLKIEQNYYAWNQEGEESNIITEFRITNNSSQSYDSVAIGILANWDINLFNSNTAVWNDENGIAIAHDLTESVFSGFAILNDDPVSVNYNTLDVSEKIAMGSINITDEEKIQQLFQLNTDTLENTNVMQTLSAVIGELQPSQSVKIAFVYTASDNSEDIIGNVERARDRYQQVLLNPREIQFGRACFDGDLTLAFNESGEYNFYSDPLGTNLLITGESYDLNSITSDTSIFIQKVGANDILGDIFSYRVAIIPTIANFSVDPDTLFLGDRNNLVNITDQTQDAVSWSWDLDNGLFSSLQNPNVIYDEEGIYRISLEVTSSLGCIDSLSKVLRVVTRGEKPIVDSIKNICIGDNIQIVASNSSSINVYFDESLDSLIFSGSTYSSTALTKNQIFYVTNTAGLFESNPVAVNTFIDVVTPSITASPSLEVLDANVIELSTPNPELYTAINWSVNNADQGMEENISFPLENANALNVLLNVTNLNGCNGEMRQTIVPAKSVLPVLANQLACSGTDVILSPGNGQNFSFYQNENELVANSKGSQLILENIVQDTVIYVRGIDDFIESDPLRVDILIESFAVTISSSQEEILLELPGLAQEVSLSAEGDINHYSWFVNDELVERVAEPILFFGTPGEFNVELVAENENGCLATDSILLRVTEPSVVTSSQTGFVNLGIYPNPTKGLIYIPNDKKLLNIYTTAGKRINIEWIDQNTINMSNLNNGVYFLQVQTNDNLIHVDKIVLRK